jgi:hypothetical protein
MSPRLRELMLEAGYAAPELAGRAQKLADLIVKDCYVALFPALRDMISRGQAYRMIRNHFSEPYDEQKAIDKAGDDLAKEIDREVMLYAGLLHEGGGYEESTHEKQAEFAKKRNYTYGEEKK